MGFLRFCIEHFTHVGPILATGAFGIAIIIERFHSLVWIYAFHHSEGFFEKIRYLVMADQINEALGICERLEGKPVVNVVKEGLLRAHQPESIIEHGLQYVVDVESEKIQARTGFLSTIANVATLLGLFGTILGLVQSFEAVGNANAQARSAMLAAGIAMAMNATMLGLGVAIPCMIAYSFLMNRTNRLVKQLDQAAILVLDLLKQRYYASADNNEAMPPRAKQARRK